MEEKSIKLAVDLAISILEEGGIILYPTDTVYGLGGDATNEKVVEKIHSIKRINQRRPMSVLMSDYKMLEEYCEFEKKQIEKYLPGPYTLILKEKKHLPSSENQKIGIRIIDDKFCKKLVKEFGKPIISTSANITGQFAPFDLNQVSLSILSEVDLAFDGGVTQYQKSSTILDLVEKKKIRD